MRIRRFLIFLSFYALAFAPASLADPNQGRSNANGSRKVKAKDDIGARGSGLERNKHSGNMRFRGKDRNNDGIITRDEWRGNDRSFSNHDWNGDGILAGDEVRPGSSRKAKADDRIFSDRRREPDDTRTRSERRTRDRPLENSRRDPDAQNSRRQDSRKPR